MKQVNHSILRKAATFTLAGVMALSLAAFTLEDNPETAGRYFYAEGTWTWDYEYTGKAVTKDGTSTADQKDTEKLEYNLAVLDDLSVNIYIQTPSDYNKDKERLGFWGTAFRYVDWKQVN